MMEKMERLTDCEELVMKIVWDAETEIGLADVTQRVNETFNREWAPQTVSTFLARLIKKGYLKHYRRGRVFYYQILVPKEKYVKKRAEEFAAFWNLGNAAEFFSAIFF